MAWHPTWNEPERRESRYRHVRVQWGTRGAAGTWAILVATVLVYLLLQSHGRRSPASLAEKYGELVPALVLLDGQVWRLLTFQFLHGGAIHILGNMFLLWMFGRAVEFQIGTRRFLWLYLLSGVAGGLGQAMFDLMMSQITGDPGWMAIPSLGASAGVMGILIAFAVMNPHVPLLVYFVLPVRAWYVAVVYFFFESWPLFDMVRSRGTVPSDNIGHAAHLGGMIYALAWVIFTGRVNWPVARGIRRLLPSRPRAYRPDDREVYRQHPVVSGPNTGGNVSRDASSEEEQRLDAVLRKIHESGLESLSDDERRFLRYMSERGGRNS